VSGERLIARRAERCGGFLRLRAGLRGVEVGFFDVDAVSETLGKNSTLESWNVVR
jgi:hypothetical protein